MLKPTFTSKLHKLWFLTSGSSLTFNFYSWNKVSGHTILEQTLPFAEVSFSCAIFTHDGVEDKRDFSCKKGNKQIDIKWNYK